MRADSSAWAFASSAAFAAASASALIFASSAAFAVAAGPRRDREVDQVRADAHATAVAIASFHAARPLHAFIVRKEPKGHGTGQWLEAAARIGARVCEVHTGPYAHAFHAKGRDPESAAVVAELEKIRAAGAAIRAAGMRFNAGHALNYFNVQPVAALPGIRELHIGHAIIARSVFAGLREAVRQMKVLIREAAR